MTNPTKQSTDAALRAIRCPNRRKFSPERKIRIVLEGLRGEESISELCCREGTAANLHCACHRWATFALTARKSVRGVAHQLGHADPALTLRVYAHAMHEEETDRSFAEFGGSERLYPAPKDLDGDEESRNPLIPMARREGLEPPTLRFEERRKGKK